MAVPDYRELISSQIPALRLLMALGYEYLSPAEALALRGGRAGEVVLTGVLEPWLHEHNGFSYRNQPYAFSENAIREGIRKLTDEPYDGLIPTSERLYELLTLGTSLEQIVEGDRRSFSLHYIDWQRPQNNIYHVTEEFTVERRRSTLTRCPDIVCFVNGIPLAVIECKRPDLQKSDGSLPYEEAVSQMIRNQGEDEIPHLFTYAQLLLAVSKNHARYATAGTPKAFWAVWKEEDDDAHEARTHALVNQPLSEGERAHFYGWRDRAYWIRQQCESEGERLPTEQARTLVSLLDPARLLELAYQFMLYDNGVKKVARYQQYYAIRATIDRVSSLNAQGERTGGVIWHTTGSGKSLTMVMLAKALALHPGILNPRVILVTDRVDLDDQIYGTFKACGKSVVQADSGRHLVALVRSPQADIIATVINKFETAARDRVRDDNPNIFVLVDESHRGQYGEIHSQMKQVFRRGCYIGFTGTPLTQREKNTAATFGSFIHKYTMRQAVADQAVAPLLYEGRLVDLAVDKAQIDRWFERVTRDLTAEQKADLKRKMSLAEEIGQVDQRIHEIAFDLSEHYRKNFQGHGFKAQLATSSKAMALKYKHYLDEIGSLTSAVVISPPDTREGHEEVDGDTSAVEAFWKQMMTRYGSEERYLKEIIADFARADGVELLIVVDKLLVGFDEPRNTVLYIDKPLHDHAILQAIARVNRLYEGKDFGYVVDYRGILGELNEAVQTYDALAEFDTADVAGTIMDVASEFERLPQVHSDLWAVFQPVGNQADSEALERFLEPEDRRQVFYDALDAYTRCLKVALSTVEFFERVPEEQIRRYKRDMQFFHNLRMAVRLRYAETVNYRDYEQKIRKLLDDHIDATGVTPITNPVEIFDRQAFDLEVERVTGAAARADTIVYHLKRTIIENMERDPAFYAKFSELIEETIEAYRQGRLDDAQYLEQANEMRDQVREGRERGLPPQLNRYRDASAYYGILRELLAEYGLSEDDLADMAIAIEAALEPYKIRDWRRNEDVLNRMRNAIDDYLCEAEAQYHIALTDTDIKLLIGQVIQIARKR